MALTIFGRQTLITMGVVFIVAISSSALYIPEDVEMINGQPLPEFFGTPGGSRNRVESEDPQDDEFIRAIRNRRALTYHIKTVPRTEIEEEAVDDPMVEYIPRRLIKRDLGRFAKMDVSAQYLEQLAIDRVKPRHRREVIEEEDIKNGNQRDEIELTETPKVQQWIPQGSLDDEDIFEKNTETKKTDTNLGGGIIAEALTDKFNGREARGATKDQWVKLPFLARPLENDQLSSSMPSLDEINHRVPRVNFVTQGKGLQTAESRNQRESIPRRSLSSSDIRTDIYPPDKDKRARSLDYTTYSRRSYYYPDDYRRPYDDNGYYDDYNSRRDPYYDRYDYKNSRGYYDDYSRYRDPYDRYDNNDDYYRYDRYEKPRRIIYYASLPDVVRTPPNVYRSYPNRYYDDDRYSRDARYYDSNRSGTYPYSRYPYSALKKSENEGPRDLSVSNSIKKTENQKRQEQVRKANEDKNRVRETNSQNHLYTTNSNSNRDEASKGPHQTLYHDITRMDSDFHRYDHPSFQTAVDDPYVSRHD